MRPKFYSSPKSELSTDLKIGIFLGGNSSERAVSVRSGKAVYQALKGTGLDVSLYDPRHQQNGKWKNFDLVFLALHGHGGEDGKIQRLLDSKKISYTGSDPLASQRAFNKKLAKRLFVRCRIPTAPYQVLNQKNWKKILNRFPAPYFVKPVSDGSSMGVFCVEGGKIPARRIRQAIRHYGELLVEKKITGREFTVGILGNQALPVVELRPKRAFYDYYAKYTKGMTQYLAPAPIAAALRKKLQKTAVRVHRALGLRDFSRIDIMVDNNNHIYVLEANSIPGLTELSLLPKAARAAGISFQTMCLKLLDLAYTRSSKRLNRIRK